MVNAKIKILFRDEDSYVSWDNNNLSIESSWAIIYLYISVL